MRILVAEDEKMLAKVITKILEKNHYNAEAVFNGEDALSYILSGDYDAVILDIMMPKLDGISVLKTVRARGISTPILILSAKSEVDDKVLGLDSGANDYLPKPFDSRELLTRIRCITRTRTDNDSRLRVGNIVLDRTSFDLSSPFGSFHLANKEFQLMECFMANPRTVFSVERLMEKVWECDSETDSKVVWVYIAYLRKKLSALKSNVQITTSRNAGYYLEVSDVPQSEA